MTVEEKLLELARKLAEKTDQGEVSWEETGEVDKYLTTFAHISVTIASTSVKDSWGTFQHGHTISLLDEEGKAIEELFCEERPSRNSLAELYVRAKRRAHGVDQALDEILAELA